MGKGSRGVFDEPVLQALKEEAMFIVKIQLGGGTMKMGAECGGTVTKRTK